MEAALLSTPSAAIMSETSHFTAVTSRCMQLGDSKMNYGFLVTVSSGFQTIGKCVITGCGHLPLNNSWNSHEKCTGSSFHCRRLLEKVTKTATPGKQRTTEGMGQANSQYCGCYEDSYGQSVHF